MSETKMKQKELKRRHIIDSINRIDEFLENFQPERDSKELAIRLSRLEKLMEAFEAIQNEYDTFDDSEKFVGANLRVRAVLEEQYFRIKGGLMDLIPPTAPAPVQAAPVVPGIHHLSGVKLPTISLPQFDGDLNEWLTFHDSFNSLIHSSAEIPTVQKFQYLRSVLKGDALKLIESLTITANNYGVAWEALLNRYSNPYLLKKKHLQALIVQPRTQPKSASTLRVVLEEFQRHVKILQQLGEPTTQWSSLLVQLLCSRIDEQTLKDWEEFVSADGEPTYTNLVEFLTKKIRTLESLSITADQFTPSFQSKHNPPLKQPKSSHGPSSSRINSYATTENEMPECHACSQQHLLVKCPVFQKMTLKDRLNMVNSKKICSNCFRGNHFVRKCSSNFSCRICQKRHHTLLHPGFETSVASNGQINQGTDQGQSTQSNPVSNAVLRREVEISDNVAKAPASFNTVSDTQTVNVFLSTVVLIVVDKYGREHLARALLDSGSQCSLMSERLCQQLRLVRQRINQPICGVGESQIRAFGLVSTEIRSRLDEFSVSLNCLVLRNITTSLPAVTVSKTNWIIPEGINLADPDFKVSRKIDMIIGAEYFNTFLKGGRISLGKSSPTLVESVFGWLVSGKSSYESITHTPLCNISTLESLDTNIGKFWRIEEINTKILSPTEQHCEEYYKHSVSRDLTGRYTVKYPKRKAFPQMIGESYQNALRRLGNLERKLDRDDQLKERYYAFMKGFVDLGHMREVLPDEEPPIICYLPQHPVVKESSTTTKVRGVFDASAKTSSGYSLNDAFLVGPVIQDDLYAIVLRFRKYRVVLLADIEKMYCFEDDLFLQCVLLRFGKDQPITKYVLTTVTYGLAPSSFLATRTLRQLAEDEVDSFPHAAEALKKDFYMDDFIRGENSVESAIQLRREMTELLKRGGFRLRKWCSNIQAVLEGVPEEDLATQSNLSFDSDETIKTLGINWEPSTDQFRFSINISRKEGPITKRKILSEIAQLYDPLGLIAPIIVRAKVLMQQLWMLSLDWDEEIPIEIETTWTKFVNELPYLANFRIDRYAFEEGDVQLHCFADASDVAYGACLYVRSVGINQEVKVELLTSKSRVAPLKKRSIPRLELCAAQIAAHLATKVRSALDLELRSIWFWSDSMVVLHWLRSPSQTWKTFISNRVADIQILTHGSRWRHVPGLENPADLVSRGMEAEQLMTSRLWRHGPDWLQKGEDTWPKQVLTLAGSSEVLLELRDDFWPTNGRRAVRSIIRNCVRCTRTNPHPIQQPVGQIPPARITPSRPFASTGIDYCGPVYVKAKLRKGAPIKAYIALFVCFSTKAVHIELVGDLSTSSFISALKRFIARRGLPANIYSDNATNFAGARHELHELYRMLNDRMENAHIATCLATNGIKWHMIPPRAPNFGGLWEAAVKVAKRHLLRQVGNSTLLQEDLETVLVQIEGCMNSRPLVVLSDDPNDLQALTPGHFLVGSSLQAIPEPDLRETPINRLDRYQLAQQKVQHFWYRWMVNLGIGVVYCSN
ncbi:uncharacterized protein LOC129766576 [Toxorhynchites rutilus septentrionalis]|uniref:uncharacterized protein LOC129766576 n=1 Tax=Toxorhynchites rutilus septentrionalis TaxID=329112 RepID=UPI00247AA7B2|nr:uncharacterized protein LOC129766576 [Toxorhynchites rutilus septentrionalis]